jgi:predicted porin
VKIKSISFTAFLLLGSSMAAYGGASVYGVMDMELARISNGEKSGLFLLSRNSRIGFKGAEALHGGLSAIWQIESDLDSMTNNIGDNSGWATRNTYAGLRGGFGTILLGRYETPYTIISKKIDLFNNHLGDARGVTNFLNSQQNIDNLIAYTSPDLKGLNLMVTKVVADTVELERGELKGGIYSFGATYGNGPLFIGAAYQYICGAFKDGCGSNNPEPFDALTAMNIAMSYRVSVFKIVATYGDEKLGEIDKQSGNDLFLKYLGIGGAWFRGVHTFKAQYYQTRIEYNSDQAHSSLLAVGYDYALSQKTMVYAEYARIDNQDSANALFEDVVPTATDAITGNYLNPDGLGLGLKIKF